MMGEVQEFVNSLNQFLANLNRHQNLAQTPRDKDVPNCFPKEALPVPHDEGTSMQLVRTAQFEHYQVMNFLQHKSPLVAFALKSMGHVHASKAESTRGLKGLRETNKPMFGITLVWRNKGKFA